MAVSLEVESVYWTIDVIVASYLYVNYDGIHIIRVKFYIQEVIKGVANIKAAYKETYREKHGTKQCKS